MSLKAGDEETLRLAGFTEFEIRRFETATTPDGAPQPPLELDSPVWQRVLESRRSWIEDKIDKGWTESEINAVIMEYYKRDSKRNPFDFLKAEYKPPLKRDFYKGVRERSQRMINSKLGKYYGRRY